MNQERTNIINKAITNKQQVSIKILQQKPVSLNKTFNKYQNLGENNEDNFNEYGLKNNQLQSQDNQPNYNKQGRARSHHIKQDLNTSYQIRTQGYDHNKMPKKQLEQVQQQNMIVDNYDFFNDFKTQGYDVIDIKNGCLYMKMIIFINIIFYYSSNQQNSKQQRQSNYYKMRGKLYQTNFDQNHNPQFIIQEGEFLVDIKKNVFKLEGQGIGYQGKSNISKIITNQPERKLEHKSSSVGPIRIRIIEIVDGNQVLRCQKLKTKNIWCKYNQQISLKDVNKLDSSQWLSSNVIDSYVLNLNLQSQIKYFSLNQKERQEIKKVVFVPSSVTTNFGQNYIVLKASEILQQHFLEFQEIKYEFQTVFSKIGFPINSRNTHWYFLLFDLEEKKVELFDSLLTRIHNQSQLSRLLSELLMLKNPEIVFNKQSGKQKDFYSCGYHVCQFMKFCQEQQFQKDLQYQYDEKNIKSILQEVIKDEER